MRLSIEARSARADRELWLLEMSFQYGFLSGRVRAGEIAQEDQRRLDRLRTVFEGDGPLHSKRQHRRHATYLPVVVSTEGGQGHGILLNFSNGGLFLATHHAVSEGSEMMVKVGRPGEVEYIYNCEVTRTRRGHWINGVACRLTSPPLELRPN